MVNPNQNPAQADDFRKNVISSAGFWLGGLIISSGIIRHLIAPMVMRGRLIIFLVGAMLFCVPFLLKRGFSTRFCGTLLLFSLMILGINAGMINGGIRAPASVVFVLSPVIGFLCVGKFGARAALLFSSFGILSLLFAEKQSWVMPINHPDKYSQYVAFIFFIGAGAAYAIGSAYEKSRRRSEELISNLYTTATQSAKMASLGQLSAGVAHEINNPLAIIRGSIHLLPNSKDDPEKFAAKLESINNAVNRISKIVGGLKKFSRTDEDSPQILRPLSEIVNEALDLTKTYALINKTPVSFDCQTSENIQCNDIEIEQVLINLINNAIDATKSQNEKWIKIRLSEDGPSLVLTVNDSGPGIPKNIQQRLFEPFFTTKKVGEGTGLGLSITKGILDKHQASIRVLDEKNTCFEVRFPRVMS